MIRKSVRLSDIAKELNVSTVTVSNALANQKGVSEELREKIKRKAAQMGYQPPQSSAGTRISVNIGVLVSEKYLGDHMSFYWKLYQELSLVSVEKNCILLFNVLKMEAEAELEMPLIVQERKADGIIVMGELSRAYLRKLEEAVTVPLAFLDFYAGGFDVDSVVSNNFYGMHMMTRYLVKRGHKRIAYVGSVFANSSITDRYFGFLKAVRQYGLEERADWVIGDRRSDFELRDPKLPDEMPTAFVCECDLSASYLIRVLEKAGYRVPEDVSVVGYDNFLAAHMCDVEITSFGVDMPAMARAVMDMQLDRIRNGLEAPGRLGIVSGRLVEKESVRTIEN